MYHQRQSIGVILFINGVIWRSNIRVMAKASKIMANESGAQRQAWRKIWRKQRQISGKWRWRLGGNGGMAWRRDGVGGSMAKSVASGRKIWRKTSMAENGGSSIGESWRHGSGENQWRQRGIGVSVM
jgi:hypothetical protein